MTRMLVAATAASVLAAGTGLSARASLRPTAPDTTARAALFTTVNVTEKEYTRSPLPRRRRNADWSSSR